MSAILASYVETTEIADAYLLNNPRASNLGPDGSISWVALTAAQKAWYLQEATKKLDRLPLKGDRYYWWDPVLQKLEFPRIIDGVAHDWSIPTATIHVPQRVINACLEEALALLEHYSDTDDVDRLKAQRAGVTHAGLGSISETWKDDAGIRYKGLLSRDAYEFIVGYISGSVEARFGRSIIVVDGTSSMNELPENSR